MLNLGNGLVKNVGWPDWYGDFTKATSGPLDAYNVAYNDVLTKDDFFEALLTMTSAVQITENLGLLKQSPDRTYFGASPATVGALSITYFRNS